MHITTRVVVVAIGDVLHYIELEFNIHVVYLNMYYSIAIIWIFIHVKKVY